MKAISIKQPWAWLILEGIKPVENRSWKFVHRGPLLIHASKTIDYEGYGWVETNFSGIGMPSVINLKTGGIIGKVNVTDCVTSHPSPWFCGPFGLVMEDPEKLDYVQFRGMPGLFDVPDSLITVQQGELF